MEPFSAVGPSLQVAKAIKERIDAQAERKEKDAKYYSTWIEVASMAILGLEAKYTNILAQAANCYLDDPKVKAQLLEHNRYVHSQ